MLSFSSGNTRSVNARRAVLESLELAAASGHGQPGTVLLCSGYGHDLRELDQVLRTACPGTRVLATSCAGVIGRDGPGESIHDIALMGLHGDGFRVSHVHGVNGDGAHACGAALARGLLGTPLPVRMVVLMACGPDLAGDGLISGIESVLGSDVVIFGATSTDPMRGAATFMVLEGERVQQAAFAVGIWDPSLVVESGATHGFMAIDPPLQVTRARGNRVHQLDGRPAWARYLERLGLEPEAGLAATLAIGALAEALSPEQAAAYGNDHILRAVTDHCPEDGALTCSATLREGQNLWLTLRDERRIFDDTDRLLQRMVSSHPGRSPVAVFHADCLARGRRLFDRVMKEELVHRMQHPLCGSLGVPPWLGL
ncbi:MAG: FIST signal transduction protein, partial [Cyanobacteriota bacterium]